MSRSRQLKTGSKPLPSTTIHAKLNATDELWGTGVPHRVPRNERGRHQVSRKSRVHVIGTDAYGFNKPFTEMGARYAESGDDSELWPAHFAGRDIEYCQIEKMANLGELPRRTEIPIVAQPIKIEDASAGWIRPLASIEQ